LRGIAESTRQSYPKGLTLFFRFLADRSILVAGCLDVAAIDATLLGDYQAFLFEYVSPKTGQRLKSNSQLRMLLCLVMFCKFLAATHRLAKDPGKTLRMPRQTRGLFAGLLTIDEVRKLLAQPNTNTVLGFRDRAILEVFWCCGLRISELLSLAVADINFAEGLLTIRHGKGGKERVVPLGNAALAWLREYIARVRPLLARPARDEGGTLFLSCRGWPLDVSGLLHRLHHCQRRAGLRKNLTGHSFRHTLATEMLKRGADLRHIQTLLGHEQLTSTQGYTHIVKAELKKVHGKTHPRERVPFAGAAYHGSRA
jgi:integrase/recombinase XerD